MFRIEGIVELHLKDATTGELIEKREQKNTFTVASLYRWLTQGSSSYGKMLLSTDRLPNDRFDMPIRLANALLWGYTSSGVTSPTWTEAAGAEPAYATFTQRFDPPSVGTSRTFWSVILTNDTSYFWPAKSSGTYYETGDHSARCQLVAENPPNISYLHAANCARVLLDNSCTQTDTQVLDVYYRIKFVIPDTTNNENGISSKFAYYVARRICGFTAPYLDWVNSSWTSEWPETGQSHPGLKLNNVFFPMDYYNESAGFYNSYTPSYNAGQEWHSNWSSPIGVVPFTNSTDFRLYKRKMSYSLGLTDAPGRIFGTMLYGGTNNQGATAAWHDVVPTSAGANSKMQPVHNHNGSSVLPFIDINNLAVGQGNITLDGTGWVNKDFPEWYKIYITKTGEPNGAARYCFSKRNFHGFNGNSYANRVEFLGWFTAAPYSMFEKNHGQIEHLPITTYGGYGANLACGYNALKFDFTSIVTSDKTGVQWTSLRKPQSYAWDATSTPALPVTYVQQMAVKGDEIWVGCRNTGLWMINKPNNTVTQFTIPGATTQRCFGVDIGYNGAICAVMDGGIAISTNGGTNWILYNSSSAPTFTFAGISDNNWSTVAYLRVDPSAVDYKMLLVRDWGTSVSQTVSMAWWSTTTAATAGISSTTTQYLRQNKHLCDVSDKGWWVGVFDNGTRIKQLTFNAATVTDTTKDFTYRWAGIMFDELPTGDQILWMHYGFESSFYSRMITRALRRQDSTHLYEHASFTEYGGAFDAIWRYSYRPIYLGQGIFTFSAYGNGDSDAINGTYPRHQFILNLAHPEWDTLNGGTYAKTFIEDWRWNGSAWEKGYLAPLVDSSGNNRHGVRKLFFQESHTFIGDSPLAANDGYESHVIIDDAVSNASIMNKFTIAMTVASTQTAGWAVLTDLWTANAAQKMLFAWNTTTTNTIGIWNGASNTEFGVHPTDGLAHRVVLTVNGTTVKCYIDGLQFGTTKTIISLPLSNIVKGVIGASGHAGFIQQPFKGTITNYQLWNDEWLAADVSYDYANQAGLITDNVGTTLTTGNLKAFYRFTEPLVESKVIHTASESLIEGINIAFTAGAIGTSFVSNDHFTFGAVNGLLKDNATTYSGSYSIYACGQGRNETDIENGGVVAVVPAITGNTSVTDWRHQGLTPTPDIVGNQVTFYGKNTGVVSSTVFYGDFDVSFTGLQVTGLPAELELEFGVGTPGTSETNCWQNRDFVYRIYQNAQGQFGTKHTSGPYASYHDTGILITNGYGVTAGTRLATDIFRFRRVGTTVTLSLNGTVIVTINNVYRTSFSPKMRVITQTTGSTVLAPTCTIASASASQPIVMLGNKVNKTGMFDMDFHMIDVDSVQNSVRDVKLDGVNVATRYWGWDYNAVGTLPLVNEVLILSNGVVICNAADVGKTLTATYNYLKHPV